jgi:diacylglycerol kinase (ATP)
MPRRAPSTCVILNPAAGSIRNVDEITAALHRVGKCAVQISPKRQAVERLARDAVRKGFELIVAAGGDGTLNDVVNGVAASAEQVRVGLLPLGTGNDFARSLGLPAGVEACIDVLRANRTRAIDVVRVTSDRLRYFVNVSAGGFSGVVNEKMTPQLKQKWGPLAYLRGAAAALSELRAYRTSIALDDHQALSLELYNVVIANGRYVAGGTPIAPRAKIADGLLDIVLVPQVPVRQLAVIAAQIVLGTHVSNDAVIFHRAKKVSVKSRPGMWFNVDGELVGNQPAVFEVLPRALRFVVP